MTGLARDAFVPDARKEVVKPRDPSIGDAIAGLKPPAVNPPKTQQEFEARRGNFAEALSTPEVQAGLLQFGLNLLQGRPAGVSPVQNIAAQAQAGIAAAGRAQGISDERANLERDQAQEDRGLDLRAEEESGRNLRNTENNEVQQAIARADRESAERRVAQQQAGQDRRLERQIQNEETGRDFTRTERIAGQRFEIAQERRALRDALITEQNASDLRMDREQFSKALEIGEAAILGNEAAILTEMEVRGISYEEAAAIVGPSDIRVLGNLNEFMRGAAVARDALRAPTVEDVQLGTFSLYTDEELANSEPGQRPPVNNVEALRNFNIQVELNRAAVGPNGDTQPFADVIEQARLAEIEARRQATPPAPQAAAPTVTAPGVAPQAGTTATIGPDPSLLAPSPAAQIGGAVADVGRGIAGAASTVAGSFETETRVLNALARLETAPPGNEVASMTTLVNAIANSGLNLSKETWRRVLSHPQGREAALLALGSEAALASVEAQVLAP